jgi:hypothetical protein
VRNTDKQKDRKATRKAVGKRYRSGDGEQCGKDLPVLAEPICQARNDRSGDQSDGVPAASTAPISKGPSPRS